MAFGLPQIAGLALGTLGALQKPKSPISREDAKAIGRARGIGLNFDPDAHAMRSIRMITDLLGEQMELATGNVMSRFAAGGARPDLVDTGRSSAVRGAVADVAKTAVPILSQMLYGGPQLQQQLLLDPTRVKLGAGQPQQPNIAGSAQLITQALREAFAKKEEKEGG